MSFQSSLAGVAYSSDTELAREAVAGDACARQVLFLQLRGSVHATLYRVLGSNAHMEELLQEAFIEIFRALGSYRGKPKLSRWADRIAVRVVSGYLRRQASRKIGDRAATEAPALRVVGGQEDAGQQRCGSARLYEALRALEPEYRIAFALFALDGRSTTEVAEITGATLSTAKSRIARARRQLWDAARSDETLASYLGQEGLSA
jgi:RNA polymerase sigma-70 factor (ECF subfamily)